MGPFLFTVRIDASRIEKEAASIPSAVQRARSIGDAVLTHMQFNPQCPRQMCDELGWSIEEAGTGEDAIRAQQKYRPDLLILRF